VKRLIIGLALLALCGCGEPPAKVLTRTSVKHEEDARGVGDVKIIEIDGAEYVVVMHYVHGGSSVAICPKTPAKAESE
jgi:hypothetical protein